MKRYMIHGIVGALCIVSVSLFSCSDSENRHLALLGQAKVIIDLNLHQEDQASAGILDTIRRLFVRDAIAQSAPATFSEIRVSVTGTGMSAITRSFAPYDVISMNIPAGSLRRFEVTAYVTPGDPSPAASFTGTSTANLPAGATVSVPVVMNVNEMRLVIPDYCEMSINGKIVMFDTIKGENRISRTNTDIFNDGLSLSYYLRPYDIDFDSHLRIYFANHAYSTDSGVFRMKDMNGSFLSGTCEMVANVDQIESISIDRKRNILYYSNNSSTISRLNLGNEIPITPETVITIPSGMINAVCVDEATGYVYYVYSLTYDVIAYCNPNIETPEQISDSGSLLIGSNIFDLIVKNGFLYASDVNSANHRIVQLPLDLSSIIDTLSVEPDTANNFMGPREFIAVTSRKIYFIDESQTIDGRDDNEKIISISDINGTGYEEYLNSDSYFQFYVC